MKNHGTKHSTYILATLESIQVLSTKNKPGIKILHEVDSEDQDIGKEENWKKPIEFWETIFSRKY